MLCFFFIEILTRACYIFFAFFIYNSRRLSMVFFFIFSSSWTTYLNFSINRFELTESAKVVMTLFVIILKHYPLFNITIVVHIINIIIICVFYINENGKVGIALLQRYTAVIYLQLTE